MTHYIIGIDLGTTNCSLSYKPLKESNNTNFSIKQLTKSGHIDESNTLPSFLYIPGEHEISSKSLELPWEKERNYCVGFFARKQGSKVPGRLVNSAKSWLSHKGANRRANILPFQANKDVEKISPIEASARYLLHLKEAWNHEHPKTKLENQEIYITVPASFDAVAKELTIEAARNIGINATLIEEPLAAFYAWLENNEKNWREQLVVGDTVLVVDVGGGTTDLTLISVKDNNGDLVLQREAVGDHILLGGDNMDLALAHVVSMKLPKAKLDPWQSKALWYSCREAKEKMLLNEQLSQVPITVLGRGSSVIGGTLKTKLEREDIEEVLIDGFFPKITIDDIGQAAKKIGLTELNLPYASEPAITKHIASFLRQNKKEGETFSPPTAILFNGGVFKARAFRERITEVINAWLQETDKTALKVLYNQNLDLSVSQGASYYGQVKKGKGIRVKGGTAHSYYIGLETLVQAVPGFKPPMKALCVVPYDMEEGTQVDVPETELGLIVGEPVTFPFLSSNKRKKDIVGCMLSVENEDLEENVSIETVLEPVEGIEKGDVIPVKLHSKVTELGTLEISCMSLDNKYKWNLEFNVRKKS